MPKAWNIAHSTRDVEAPPRERASRPGSRVRISSIAVRTPLAASAGTVTARASQCASAARAGRPPRQAPLEVVRQQRDRAGQREQHDAATIAGTIVIANEPPPGNSPVPSPMPSISSEPA